MERARIVLEVTAGYIPGLPMPEHTKRWAITEAEWKDAENRANLLAERNGQMQGYAAYLMLQPDHLNWVRTDWIYL